MLHAMRRQRGVRGKGVRSERTDADSVQPLGLSHETVELSH